MVELKYLITNGYVSKETLEGYTNKGWTFVATVPAKSIHPFATDEDKATIFSKYHDYMVPEQPAEEEESREGYELINCTECGKDKWVEEGTWALDKGMCEPCYCAYEGG